MTVSVIIPTVLRSPTVGRALARAAASAARVSADAEVLLVVNGAGDTPPPYPVPANARIVHSSATCVSQARNDGVAAARHDIILFTDDDLTVPPDWCATMAAPLLNPSGPTAVGAPVRMAVAGPVTAFLDHERMFDAPPAGESMARALVTANAGYRRDRFGEPPFDTARYPQFAEDHDFGLRIIEAGGTIGWLADATPPEHEVDEDLPALIRRGVQRGAGGARLYLQRKLPDYYIPAVCAALAGFTHGAAPTSLRRYAELGSEPARAAFIALSLIRQTVILTGYAQELGRQSGTELVSADIPALTEGASAVIAELTGTLAGAGYRWEAIPVRFPVPPPGTAPVDQLPPAPPALDHALARLAALFHRTVTVTAQAGRAAVGGDDLTWMAWDAQAQQRLITAWRKLGSGEPTQDQVMRAARVAKLPFGRACSIWESATTGTQVRRWPGAAPVQRASARPLRRPAARPVPAGRA
jgi:hypothetical protein